MSECSKIPYATRWIALVAMRAIARSRVARGLTGPRGTYFCSLSGAGTSRPRRESRPRHG
jgi:hypothetical protein